MKIKATIVGVLLFTIAISSMAQNRKTVRKSSPVSKPVVVEETPAERLFKSMLSGTAKVMFIDSIVTDKDSFLSQIPLNSEAGKLSSYEDFFHHKTEIPLGVFANEFGDRCYYAEGDSLGTRIYALDRLGDKWSDPRQLTEIGREYQMPNYPFLMSDGITLLFSAKGEQSLGGYDIFMTIYDSDSRTFYRPENYGMPFNSTANDYLVAYDELDAIGWLVSDRFQPEGKVCIYIFEPVFPRISLGNEDISDERLRSLARLNSISDTWGFGNRQQALERYQTMLRRDSKNIDNDDIHFVINDNTIYHSVNNFISPETRKLYQQFHTLMNNLTSDEEILDNQRERYAKSTAREQRGMAQSILRLEHQISEQKAKAHSMEKEIRRIENLLLKN